MEEKELEEKILIYRFLEARFNSLMKEREILLTKLLEIQTSMQSIEEIKKSDEILFAIGSEAYVFGRIKEKERVILDVGGGIALEKTPEEAKKTLEKRKLGIEKTLNEVERNIVEISSRLQKLAPEIEKLAKSG
ncbi:MAG: prefoldin subunit alpha [Candidatus Aenigmatarchaeota archaeon]